MEKLTINGRTYVEVPAASYAQWQDNFIEHYSMKNCPRCGSSDISHNGVTEPLGENHFGCRDCWNTWYV